MAAAFAALVSLKNNLRLINNHPTHSFSFEDEQILSLKKILADLIDFMESYDNSYGPRKEAAEALEMRIAHAAQAAEDVIESHVVDQIRGGKTRSKTRSSRFLLDLQKVIEGMDYMRRKAINVKAQSGMEAEEPTYSAAATISSPTTLTSKNTSMVGSDDVLFQLLHMLTGVPSSRQVIPIVGMGGIGKTTLARSAFLHSCVVHHFDVCLWATISQQYSVEKIIAQLLSHLSGSVDDERERLYKSLFGRRYLIILDDMWSLEAWDEINFLFPDRDNGSRIVVTTRHSGVAKHLSNSGLPMRCLNVNCSWDLFRQKAFAEKGCPPELEESGKKIVQKCKGLPLAIVVVGGHLRKSPVTLEYWENVAKHMNSIGIDEQCLNVLSLSYSYLPAHLKPCFLLLGAFAEDQRINVEDVCNLWIAEGFIEHYEKLSLEEVADYYIWDLCQRNLILVDRVDYSGKIYTFKVHDLVRELCLKIAKKEEFLSVFETPRAINKERRVVISGEVGEVDHETITSDAPIRCVICQGGWLSYDLKLLRTSNKVFTVSTSGSIFQQVNLRYLNVDVDYTTGPPLYYLPSSISLLWNLQILTISTPDASTVIAPYEIWEMLQLRQLKVYPICLVDPLPVDRLDPANDLVLRNLHSLSKVENLRLSEEVWKRIPNIRELELSYCDEASSYYCPHNLSYFHQLEHLICQFDGNSKWRDFALSLTFPCSLKSLSLSGCGVDWEELTTMVGSLPHLVVLYLFPKSVIGSVWNPVEGKFLSLETLVICGCDDLISWNADNFHFSVLKHLRLERLSKLDGFPSGIGEIATLQLIELKFCSLSSTISAMRMLVEQEEMGNEVLQLHVSFWGDEETLECFNNMVQQEGLTSSNLSLYLQNVNTKSF